MTLLSGALAMGRRAAEARMTETVAVFERVTTIDDSTLKATHADTEVWRGPARYASRGTASGGIRKLVGQDAAIVTREVSTPASAPNFRPGLFVRIESSLVDPAIVGREVVIDAPPEAGQTTAHRYPVVEAEGV